MTAATVAFGAAIVAAALWAPPGAKLIACASLCFGFTVVVMAAAHAYSKDMAARHAKLWERIDALEAQIRSRQ